MTYASGRFVRKGSRRKRFLLYALFTLLVLVVAIVAAREINSNTIRLTLRPQLSILIQGTPFTIPSGIGINASLWKDHSLDSYGVSNHSPLTTRDMSGIIFLDSNTVRNFTLFEFLSVWGQRADSSEVVGNSVPPGSSACMTVDGKTLPTIQDVVLNGNERIDLEVVNGECLATS